MTLEVADVSVDLPAAGELVIQKPDLCALLVRLEAKPGREADVEDLVLSGLPMVEQEPDTTSWFGMRLGDSTYGIFDTFESEEAREAHVNGQIPAALQDVGSDLLAADPDIKPIDVLAVK